MHTINYIILTLLFLLSFSACQEKSKKQQPPSIFESATVELTDEEICLIKLFHNRGLKGDKCMVHCLLRGEGRNVGGGCWHICYSYTGIEQVEMPGIEKCFSDSTSKP